MPGTSQQSDGLLLLLQAAKKLDENGCSHSTQDGNRERKPHNRSPVDLRYNSSCPNGYNHSKKPFNGIRCTHNELEKSRRAHLRACMESLKEQLHFDTDIPRYLRQKNLCLETCEDNEKQRCAQLLKRRQFLKKKIEEKRNRSLKLQNWRERNRNCSECSIATTSSDDSELELHMRSGNQSTSITSLVPTECKFATAPCHTLPETLISGSTCNLKDMYACKFGARPPSGLDVYDTSSSDSGFEEITISPDGTALHESVAVYCLAGGS